MTTTQPSPATVGVTFLVAAVLLFSAITGLLKWRSIYANETPNLVSAAAAQDLVSIPVAALLLLLAFAAVRTGSATAILGWAGVLSFVAYNAAIYCFSVHFGPLFLAWTALLGLSAFGAAIVLLTADLSMLNPLPHRTPTRIAAWVLIAAGVVFALLWLKEIVPDLLAGQLSSSAAAWQLPTNPVHVLDLALYLPACILSGLLILRGDPAGLRLGVPLLVWLILTCLPILFTPVMAHYRSHTPDWTVVPPVATLLTVLVIAAGLLLHSAQSP